MMGKMMILGVAVSLLSLTSPAIASEAENTVGRIQGYADVMESLADTDQPTLVLYQILSRDMDRSYATFAGQVDALSERGFRKLVDEMAVPELRDRLTGMESKPARAAFKEEVRLSIQNQKRALADSLEEMSPEQATRAIRELAQDVSSPEAVQAFHTRDLGAAVGKFFGKIVGFVSGHSLFAVVSTVVVVGAGPFLVAAKILSTAGKGVYIGFQYTKEFRYGMRKGARQGWSGVKKALEGEE